MILAFEHLDFAEEARPLYKMLTKPANNVIRSFVNCEKSEGR